MNRSRGPKPPPPPQQQGWRHAEHESAPQYGAEPARPPLPNPTAPPPRGSLPDPRYAEPAPAPPNYRYPDQQRGPDPRGYEAPAAPQPRQAPSLGSLTADARQLDPYARSAPRADDRGAYPPLEAGHLPEYPDPAQPRYGHQGQASYAVPPSRPHRPAAAPPSLPPMPPPRQDDLRPQQYDDWQQGADPAGYDLSNYGIPDRVDPRKPEPSPGYPPQRDARQPQPGWSNGRADDQSYDGYAPQADPRTGGRQAPAAAAGYDQDEYDEDDEYEDEEEPRRGSRRWLIIAALVGSIGLGGGLAYAYKTMYVDKDQGKPPIVKASKQPTKAAPESPGGKQFANQDSKILGRLEEDGGRSGGDVDANGVRRVQTLTVGRDGSVGAPPIAPVLPPTTRSTIQVPGMTIVDGFSSGGGAVPPSAAIPPPPPGARTAAAIPPPAPPPAAMRTPPAPPAAAVVRAPPAPPAPVATPALAPSGEPPAVARKQQVKTVETQTASAAAAPRAITGSGFVAVLTTRRSRMDALGQFADLRERFPVLQDKIPDVIEADLTSRNLGTMYRLVVGPPGSRQQVVALCSQLKAAGYTDCWATQY